MCGLAGVVKAGCTDQELVHCAQVMANALRHRGPDDEGIWTDVESGVAFGFCRLAIMDLTLAGHQPMQSACGRFMLMFNGEIYNHSELRKELQLKGVRFRSSSDSEVILNGIVEWGIDATLRRVVGMFAIVLWDSRERTIVLARDRFGEKPLYYGWVDGALAFASECQALRTLNNFSNAIDRDSLALYFRLKYVPEPYSIYENIWKVLPGTYLVFTPDDIREKITPDPVTYWSTMEVAMSGEESSSPGSLDESLGTLGSLLQNAVRGQIYADVPVGAFLSGGIDSSLIVALMQQQSVQPVRTFTIGFSSRGFNEAPYAKRVAQHLGTNHTELYVEGPDALKIVPSLPEIWDEPFSDSSQIPMLLVSRLAKDQVTVALSGDGGDEIFAGYNRYLSGYQTWRRIRKLPSHIRKPLAARLDSMSTSRFAPSLQSILSFGHVPLDIPTKAKKLASVLHSSDVRSYHKVLVSDWMQPTRLVLGSTEPEMIWDNIAVWSGFDDPRSAMMAIDSDTYLPGDILTKVDRASMSVSLEVRAPYLDHRVVEFAWNLPINQKIGAGEGKALTRELLKGYVPLELTDRPKSGFGVPLCEWLRGSLREWADDLLDGERLCRDGFLDVSVVQSLWQDHRSGKTNNDHRLWSVLMFQAWQDAL